MHEMSLAEGVLQLIEDAARQLDESRALQSPRVLALLKALRESADVHVEAVDVGAPLPRRIRRLLVVLEPHGLVHAQSLQNVADLHVCEARTRQHSPHHRPTASSSHSSGSSSKKLSKSGSSHRGKKKKSKQRYEPPPQMPVSLHLLSLDLVTGAALVEAYGTTRVPLSRLFVLTDDRGRRFVPQFAECEPPSGAVLAAAPAKKSPATKSGKPNSNDEQEQDSDADQPELSSSGPLRWRCHLVIPPLYRRAVLTGVFFAFAFGLGLFAGAIPTLMRQTGLDMHHRHALLDGTTERRRHVFLRLGCICRHDHGGVRRHRDRLKCSGILRLPSELIELLGLRSHQTRPHVTQHRPSIVHTQTGT